MEPTCEEIKKAKEQLLALQKRLNEIQTKESDGINIFDAVGMQRQEVKHSAFMAWLLAPNQKHGIGNAFLKKFIERLFLHQNRDEQEPNVLSNRQILENAAILSASQLDDFINDKGLDVETEKVLVNAESRMDIYLCSQATKTVLVIENKVFTSTHDEQLRRYEEEVDKSGKGAWRKIFVYLTPLGDTPYDFEEYREHWCVFSYVSILNIINDIIKELPNNKQYAKLKYLMEDYIEMVNTNILHTNNELRSLCKQIIREHRDALDLLIAYTDNAEDVIRYSKNYITDMLGEVTFTANTTLITRFYTKKFGEYFQNVAIDKKRFLINCAISATKGDICAVINLEKDDNREWTEEQLRFAALFSCTPTTGKYCTLYRKKILENDERQLSFEEVKERVNEELASFVEKIKSLEAKL